jgi:hypothetical protein
MPEWIIQILTSLGIGVAVYTGIRVDLALAKSRAEEALVSAKDAHHRIDHMFQHRRAGE